MLYYVNIQLFECINGICKMIRRNLKWLKRLQPLEAYHERHSNGEDPNRIEFHQYRKESLQEER